MNKPNFTAWSIYTGPKNNSQIIEGSSWILGEWDGINDDTSPQEIKKDIDARINIIVNSFKKMVNEKKCKYFVVPEFFFRCKQGPYPYVKVDDENYPFEYIEKEFKQKLQGTVPGYWEHYYLYIGTILTSNIEDYDSFLASERVQERMKTLNAILPTSLKANNTNKQVRFMRMASKKNIELLESTSNSKQLIALNQFMKESRANPLCTVRNRGIFFDIYKGSTQAEQNSTKPFFTSISAYSNEKQCESTVDLTMGIRDEKGNISHGGMITEWMANYNSITLFGGDKHSKPDDLSFASRIGNSNTDLGIEICLDHRKQRLRRTVGMCTKNGADNDNNPISGQVISSGGMQILDYAVAADKNSFIFNSDGCDKIYLDYGDESTEILDGESGEFTGIATGVFSKSYQSKWKGKDDAIYYSHSQLAFTLGSSEVISYDNSLGLNNEKAFTYEEDNKKNEITESYLIKIVPCEEIDPVSQERFTLFAVGLGEYHYYHVE